MQDVAAWLFTCNFYYFTSRSSLSVIITLHHTSLHYLYPTLTALLVV